MLQQLTRLNPQTLGLEHPVTTIRPSGVAEILRFLRRSKRPILIGLVSGVLLAVIYTLIAVPKFTATPEILFEFNTTPVGSQRTSFGGDAVSVSAYLDSQTEVLKSRALAINVIEELDLMTDQRFLQPPSSISGFISNTLAQIRSVLGQGRKSELDEHTEKLEEAILAFNAGLSARRVGLSYMIEVGFTGQSAELAAKIANAVVRLYLNDAIETKKRASQNARQWLENNLSELRKQVLDADRALQEFKQNDVLTGASGAANGNAERRVMLSKLENAALSAKTVYDSFLQRYTDMLQNFYSPVELKIVSPATPPHYKSGPKIRFLLAGGAAVGALLGLLFAFVRDNADQSIRKPSQVEMLGIPCLGLLPKLSAADAEGLIRCQPGVPEVAGPVSGSSRRMVSATPSHFTDILHSVKLTLDTWSQFQPAKIVAVTSTAPNEGKTTVAASLAQSLAAMGARTVLLDCDLITASLTRSLLPHAEKGLVEVASGSVYHGSVIWEEPNKHLHILPASLEVPAIDTFGIFTSPSFKNLVERLRSEYEYVIVDTQSMSPVLHIRTIASLVDAIIVVAEWGTTDINSLLEALKDTDIPDNVLVGALINKVDLKKYSNFSEERLGSYRWSA